jgi:hypothetical protein
MYVTQAVHLSLLKIWGIEQFRLIRGRGTRYVFGLLCTRLQNLPKRNGNRDNYCDRGLWSDLRKGTAV